MLLDLQNVHKSYAGRDGAQAILRGVGLQLEAGASLALTGESGSGKSTLLHLIAGLDVVDAGLIQVRGTDVTYMGDVVRAQMRRETIGLIFQQFNLIPSLDVADNVSFQARLAGRYDPDWCTELTKRLGLTGLEDRYPEQLSGGQQQRVAIGRALAVRPALVLADEPTGNLDEATGDLVLTLMLDLVRETGAGLLMVTHSARLAALLDARLHLRKGKLT